MDIFRFLNPTAPTKMEQGEIINGIKSKMWIERYSSEGEFTLIAPIANGVREKLPIGTFISHTNTPEIMIVENHEISDERGSESQVTITGRGFETCLENRVVGSNKTFPISETLADYILPAGYTWDQAVDLIQKHIEARFLVDRNLEIPFISVFSSVTNFEAGIAAERKLTRGDLFSRVMDLLAVDNLGIKIVRPGIWTAFEPYTNYVELIIHRGADKRANVIFSYDTGEIQSADYLWSNKKLKNAAFISGKWVQTVVNPTEVQYDRRMIYVDASDIDENFDAPPVDSDLTNVVIAMQRRGIDILASLNEVAITKVDVTKQGVRAIYRSDFEVGDLVTVSGDYNEAATMRVSEYVEIEDETGESGYPTLTRE